MKHARYAGELAQPDVGRPAERFVDWAKALQDVLGAHQDAVTPEFIDAASNRGIAVYCWYQQGEQQDRKLAQVAAAGLQGVVTDWPAAARRVLDTLS